MPQYVYECELCGKERHVYRKIAERDNTPVCDDCGVFTKRTFSTGVTIGDDIEPYLEENIGHEPIFIKSRKHINEICKERGLYVK